MWGLLAFRVVIDEMELSLASWRNTIKHPIDGLLEGLPRAECDSADVNWVGRNAVLVCRAVALFTEPQPEASVSERGRLSRAIGDRSHTEQSLLSSRKRPGLQVNLCGYDKGAMREADISIRRTATTETPSRDADGEERGAVHDRLHVPPNVSVQRRRADLRALALYPSPSAATGC